MILNILRVVLTIVEVLLIFNLLIIVHELGHFLAARWRGLHVEKFGIWFGRPIWKKTIKGVEYSVGWIPGRRIRAVAANGSDGGSRRKVRVRRARTSPRSVRLTKSSLLLQAHFLVFYWPWCSQ